MKKSLITLMAVAFVLALALPVLAAPSDGNGAPSGPHYNLNIIGVENPKNSTMTDSNRHTIFVALGKSGLVTTRIYLYQGPEFKVCDGNGFDPAIDCAGNTIGTTNGAVFQLPCNTNLPASGTGATVADPVLIPCETGDSATYEVWARALGKPGGKATMQTCATDTIDNTEICSTENTLEVLNRVNGKGGTKFQNVTNALTSLVYYNRTSLRYERVALFQGDLEDWFWQYDNTGLKLAQLRFYLVP